MHRILLLSDGLANVGPQSPAELGRLGAALVKENISVTTIGLGEGFNEDLMTQLGYGQPLYNLVFITLIIFFAYFYTAIIFNPDDVAENMRKYGGLPK